LLPNFNNNSFINNNKFNEILPLIFYHFGACLTLDQSCFLIMKNVFVVVELWVLQDFWRKTLSISIKVHNLKLNAKVNFL
jgi:hypothetical protein